MSQSIGGNPPKQPPAAPPSGPTNPGAANHRGPIATTSTPQASGPNQEPDSFQSPTSTDPTQGKAGKQLLPQLPIGKSGAPIQGLSPQEIAQLSQLFAAIVQQYSQASRAERAKLFAQAIVKQRGLNKMFAKASEPELEQMFDAISAMLDDSPAYAELVEEVTNASSKPRAQPSKKKPTP